MNNNINILIVEPGKAPRPAVTANTLEAAERLVGGTAYADPDDVVDMVYDLWDTIFFITEWKDSIHALS